MNHTVQQIADHVGGSVEGDAALPIRGIEQLDRAEPGQISFVRDARYVPAWEASGASAALVTHDLELPVALGRAVIRVANADLAVAQVLELFAPPVPGPAPGVDPRAVVDPSASLGQGVAIGANTVIGHNVRIGDRTVIHPNVTIGDDVEIGEHCVIWSGVVIRERCRLGRRCIVHPNAVIGADGFGYRPSADGTKLIKIPQIGTVEIGDEVEIGASTCIDRGKFSATIVGDMTKIDNLCQIAHNCRIGKAVILAGHCALAGSVTVEDGAMLGGSVGVRDHVTIGRGARVAAYSAVAEDVPPGETWSGYPAQNHRKTLREIMAVRKLPDLMRDLRQKGN